ncbi:aldose 1-epimerase family protein [Longispora sp. K20-0274]|uniref:aldose 1-epimerase family protein n=1 Tax=Longispora sp. K20-0274 TaxID=3088255 RepID=UPI00399B8B98
MEWSIAAGDQRAVVTEVGGGLRSYSAGGVDLVDGYPADGLCPFAAGQVLAPWPNRVRDGRYTFAGVPRQLPLSEPDWHNAIHGLVNWVGWRAVEVADDAVTVEYELPPSPGYPFRLLLRTRWSVGPDGLRAEHHATNTGTGPAPFGLGAHPYLRIDGVPIDDVVLRLSMRSRLLTDSRLLPIGAARVDGTDYDYTAGRRLGDTRLDTTFGLPTRDEDGRITGVLTAPDGRSVMLWADQSFRWLQLYTADGLPDGRHRRSVAVEPMTCPPDALRSGRDLVTLQPGEQWRGTWGIVASDSLST